MRFDLPSDALSREAHADSMTSARQRLSEPLQALDRVTVLAAYRLLSGTPLGDVLALEEIDRFPVEPPDGSALKFEKSWGGPTTYTYVALRVGGEWYMTGRKTAGISWPELKAFIHNNRCWIATVWAEIPVPEDTTPDDMTPAEWHRQLYTVEGEQDGSAAR